jgi:predicted dehydrogenase
MAETAAPAARLLSKASPATGRLSFRFEHGDRHDEYDRQAQVRMKGVLIGAGYFARFQAEAWRRLPAFEFAAVADAVPGKAQAFAREFGIPKAYSSVEEMLAKERPYIVDIATRPESHLELTTLAASHKADVICQKPMAPSMRECEEMCRVCEQEKVRLLVHENWRWQPWYREAKRLLDVGEIGPLRHVRFDWRTGDGTGPEPYAAQPYFRTMPRLLIYESLIHILDTFRFLAGEFRVTACETRRINPVIAGEDWAEIKVDFSAGATGFIHGDRHSGPVPSPVAMGSMLVEGEAGSIRVSPDGRVWLAAPDRTEHFTSFTPPITGYKGDSVFATQEHLLACLRSGEQAESEGRNFLKTMALVDDCYKLAER